MADRGGIAGSLGRATAWSAIDVGVVRVGNFLLGLIMARLLGPAAFGAFAVALVVHAVVVNVSDLGVGTALIRDPQESVDRSCPTVATISLVTSLLLAGLMIGTARPVASALGSGRSSSVIVIMALTLPLAGMSAVPAALLRRGFRTDRLFVADAVNLVVTYAVALPLAADGAGAAALAWGWVASQAATTIILCAYLPRRCLPGFDRTEAGRLVRYGMPLAGANVVGFGLQNTDYIVVSRLMGSVPLGLYVMASNMSGWPTNIFSTIIRSVALPALARDLDDPDQRALRFAKALRMIALISFPVCLLMAALAQPLVSTLYGTRWKEAAPALVWLAVYGAIRVGMEPFQDFVVAGGRTRVIMAIQLVWLVCLLGALLVGVDNWGIAGAGASQALVASLIVLPVYATVLRQGGVTYRMVVGALGPPFLASSLAAVAAWAASEAAVQPWQQLLFGAAAGVGVYSVVAGRGLVSMARFLRDQRASRRFNPPVVAESYETAL